MPPKLIEVSLPLDAINAESAREKSIRHGHPSTLHLWWSRKPLATVRAVLWASLVDDPSGHPDLFPTLEEQEEERRRLHDILRELVKWENSGNEKLLEAARAEIGRYMEGELPEFLDPFAGGGSIPLEAQRLGLVSHAHDLNPVAVLLNRAMIDIPARFCASPAVNPQSRKDLARVWKGANGLAADVEYYGQWLRQKAQAAIGRLYPKAKLSNGREASVIAWLWARTVKCPNPACGCEMPLAHSFGLASKKGRETYAEPQVENGRVSYKIRQGKNAPEGTVNRTGAKCVACGTPVGFPYIREEGKAGRMKSQLVAIVAEGDKCREYLPASEGHAKAAAVEPPENCPQTALPEQALGFRVQLYGMDMHNKLFTPRQLTALVTFSDLVGEAAKQAESDAIRSGMADDGIGLANGGTGAKAYGEAIGVYLALLVDKLADRNSTICSWDVTRDGVRNTFGRQAIPMVWDYAEANPFCSSSGSFGNMLEWIVKALQNAPCGKQGQACQANAQTGQNLANLLISTDPPYYDNIGYADLSDYFYIWLRRSLGDIYPDIFATMLVPKAEELVATPHRFEGSKDRAREFFESGMLATFHRLADMASEDYPVSVYYAFKQQDTKEGTSSGWETMLSGLIEAGFCITGTWPMRTELTNRPVATGTNALASSIVLVGRKRPRGATATSRRNFLKELSQALPQALTAMQVGNIAPVDMAQAAIGPGMAVFSRYSQVLEADGRPISVGQALQAINAELDSYFSARDMALDPASRFCLDLYTQNAFEPITFGQADVLARAKNTSVETLANAGMLSAGKGIVRLLGREEMPESPSPCLWQFVQYLGQALATGGHKACAKLMNQWPEHSSPARELCYRLYSLAERKHWSEEAQVWNNLVTAWPEMEAAAMAAKSGMEQGWME